VPKRVWVPDDPLALLPRTVRGGFADPALMTAVAARLAAQPFDLVQYEFLEMANLMPPSDVPRLVTVHQVGFAQEAARWRAAGRTLLDGPATLFRYCRDLDWELSALGRVHQAIVMSPEDAARLVRFLPDLRVAVSPVGVDCREFHPAVAPCAPDADLLFVGHFLHPPNVDAARFLVEDVVPRVGRPVRVRIVGHAIPPRITALARPGAVEVSGPVADLRPTIAAAAVVTAPVRFGTGMRGKVLEALAMGRPVVTTSLGAEGLGAVSNRDLLIADDAASFAGAVRRIFDEPGLGARLGAAGRRLVEARFDWDAIADAHERIYQTALDMPVSPPAPSPVSGFLTRALARTGWAPALASGVAIAGARALRWHLRHHPPVRLSAGRT
jgi:glycosyltransferase involved in cell wall biosynthesis